MPHEDARPAAAEPAVADGDLASLAGRQAPSVGCVSRQVCY
jgi:hypothetical protein